MRISDWSSDGCSSDLPRTSRNSLARWAAPEPTMTEQRAVPGQDERYMRIALGLAARGLGNTWPNPAVGCVIVKDGRIVGRGWTQVGGRPHAEPHALAEAGVAARGDPARTRVVTGKSGGVRLCLGGDRYIKKNKQ